uniref:Uncharacterized protein n=1 Tax=Mus musculus TaxID=10090 RepID=M9QLH2_MOUSE|nr:hypothetical protein P63-2 [Mus musculus]
MFHHPVCPPESFRLKLEFITLSVLRGRQVLECWVQGASTSCTALVLVQNLRHWQGRERDGKNL